METDNKQINYNQAVRTYVLRAGRMTDAQRKAYSELYQRYGITMGETDIVSSESLFGNGKPLILEIGFGMGQATAAIAKRRPDTNFLGMEVHTPGVGKLLSLVEQESLDNVRVYHGDALAFIADHVAPESVHGIHVFFPDSWPKKRHHKRRIISSENLAFLSQKLEEGGYIYFITDWEEYAREAKEIFDAEETLSNKYENNWAETQEWRQTTKFEHRAEKEGRLVRELYYIKRDTKPSADR